MIVGPAAAASLVRVVSAATGRRPSTRSELLRTTPTASRLARSVPWLLWVLLSAAHLRPVLGTTVVADDLINPVHQFDEAGPGLLANLRYAADGVEASGHFNYLGQALGAVYNQLWLWTASRTDLSLLTLYAATKLAVLLLTALAVAAYVRAACRLLGRDVGAWWCRAGVSVALFGTLQLHVVWSNDPVASYPLSGFASAALGFALLLAALRWGGPERPWGPAVVGLLGLATVLYYEIDVAAVLAVGAVVLWHVLAVRDAAGRLQRLVRCSPALLVPFVLTVALQRSAAAAGATYGGTDVAVGQGLPGTLRVALASGVPGAGWDLSRDYLAGSPLFRPVPALVLAVVLGVLAVQAGRHPLPAGGVARGALRRGWLLLAAPVVYGVGASGIQAATAKVQQEVTAVGMVYNFYAVSAAAVAALCVLTLLLVPVSTWARPAVGLPVAVAAGLLVLTQTMVNASVAERFNATFLPANRVLLQAYSDEDPPDVRCSVLRTWTTYPLPAYYRQQMVDGLQAAYRHYHGESFCPAAAS